MEKRCGWRQSTRPHFPGTGFPNSGSPGIDKRHYEHYLRIDKETPWRVWLLFLHEGGQAKDSPAGSPDGLYGEEIWKLAHTINHASDRWGKSGMVYWSVKALKKLAQINELGDVSVGSRGG